MTVPTYFIEDPHDQDERLAFERSESAKDELAWRDGPKGRRCISRAALTCPTCKRAGALTAREARKGYQCVDCTRRDEGVGF